MRHSKRFTSWGLKALASKAEFFANASMSRFMTVGTLHGLASRRYSHIDPNALATTKINLAFIGADEDNVSRIVKRVETVSWAGCSQTFTFKVKMEQTNM
jgi:hypothetical protein